ncbi:NADH-quinone oxidoreductase subunit N [Vulcanibacillus modesticaldus]|uniref:NADH-quinone oxidoreductase subunit N n=1 Tax=Vulcanibacillus modesticaldus TaxID=337097 RepID=A0A1D2YVR5_9BACI|nr:NADH-quinone oxidoreductase subunit N [Vulcanibacillus modesticaldus]OEF99818.1 NADH-quinone oxidoreductase subunit N [Vulcanibacillus modesticaldus]
MNLLELNWGLLAPELTIIILAAVITIADLVMSDKGDRKIFGWVSIVGIVIAIYFTLQQLGSPVEYLLENSYRVDSFGSLFKLIFLVGTGIVFIMSINYIDKEEIPHDGEFYYLLLTALVGAMIMASSADIITLYIGLELLSFSSYIMVGIRKKNLKSNEAAFKYIITGLISSTVFLYGVSFIYGLTGSTNLLVISERLPEAFTNGFDFYVYLGFFMILVGLSYKIAAVPSYMWAPDVYEGAPTPVTAFLAVISKAAGFAIIIRILVTIFVPIVTEYNFADPSQTEFFFFEATTYLAIIAALTMIIGNTMAIFQSNAKRLLALSSVAHAGYILIPLASMKSPLTMSIDISNMIFYLVVYLIMNLGVFTVVTIVNRDADTEDITSFRGLYHRNPLLGVAMSFFLISLAGLPVSAGFIAKFNIFVSAITVKSYWLAGIMVVTSVISYFYYFNIIRQMYMRPGRTEAKLRVSNSLQFVILLAFLGVLLLGIFPNTLLDFIYQNFNLADLFTVGFQR